MQLQRSTIRNGAFIFLLLLFLSPVTQSQALVARSTAPLLSTAPPAYMEYALYNNTVIEDPVLPPVLSNGSGDYAAIFQRHQICQLVASGAVDEVWL